MSDEGLQQARTKMAEAGVDPVAIDDVLSSRSRAILVCHPWGHPAPIEALRERCADDGDGELVVRASRHGPTC